MVSLHGVNLLTCLHACFPSATHREAAIPAGHSCFKRNSKVPKEHRASYQKVALLSPGENVQGSTSPALDAFILSHLSTYILAHEQVREISNMVAPEPFRWTAEGLLALQEVRRGCADTGLGISSSAVLYVILRTYPCSHINRPLRISWYICLKTATSAQFTQRE